jgi:hypothetical protein
MIHLQYTFEFFVSSVDVVFYANCLVPELYYVFEVCTSAAFSLHFWWVRYSASFHHKIPGRRIFLAFSHETGLATTSRFKR